MKPICILLTAMGGEGGGVLTDWLVQAARAEGLAVQATSIPGVAQRTGATTYYIEIFPTPLAHLGGKCPVLATAPSTAEVDLILATELMEAARAIGRGFAEQGRTRVIASTHRVYAVAEKTAMGDGRLDSDALRRTIAAGCRSALLFDMDQAAREAGSIINSVLLGALAGSGVLPIRPEVFEAGIRAEGKAVDSNLKGFAAGMKAAQGGLAQTPPPPAKRPHPESPSALALMARAAAEFPEAVSEMAKEGVKRLVRFQDTAYAQLYLERLAPVWATERDAGGEGMVTRSVARHLAVRMGFDDVIRVAQLKTDPARFERIRAELGAAPGEPVVVRDFLKPGLDEVCGLLPSFLARPLLSIGHRRGWLATSEGRQIASTGILGFSGLWMLSKLKGWRRHSHRFAQEQSAIGRWLELVITATRHSPALGLEVAECARLVKGYGETWERGQTAFARIRDEVVVPGLDGGWPPTFIADAIASARAAALSDPEGKALDRTLEAVAAKTTSTPQAAA